VLPRGKALMLNLLRYPSEVIPQSEYSFPASAKRVNRSELAMAEKLVEALSGEWKPEQFKDEFRARLKKVIVKRLKGGKTVEAEPEEGAEPAGQSTNVVDFVSLLKQSLAEGGRAPAKKKAARRAAPRKKAARKSAARKRA
jgi:DNA end-binding protein Ku